MTLGYILLSIIVIYLLSAIRVYEFLKKCYTSKGRWSSLDPDFNDIFMLFCPIINTLFFLISLIMSPYREEYQNNDWIKKFFNIKR